MGKKHVNESSMILKTEALAIRMMNTKLYLYPQTDVIDGQMTQTYKCFVC